MRRHSQLPTDDPYEKPDRYQPKNFHNQGLLAAMKEVFMSPSQKARWIKTGAIALVVILVFVWFSPSGVELLNNQIAYSGENNGQTPSDSSYGTKKCAKSYSKDKPIVQYVLMIDAGSTGSRIHAYKFNNCGPVPELEGETFEMTEKSVGGLSKYKDDPKAAAATLDPLLATALSAVPEKLRGCSPIAVKATAGLRMIGTDAAQAILDEVRRHLEDDFPFPVVTDENEGVAIMDGSDEGVYAWITVNYLLGKIGGADKGETAAIFDLGGGSTQIVFEPTFKGSSDGGMPDKLAEGDHKYSLDFGGQKFDLYQHSHLGFGLMAARSTIHEALIADLISSKGSSTSWMSKPITHPCFPPGMTKEIDVKVDGDEEQTFTFTGPTSSSAAQCRSLAEKILDKSADCALAPCSFNGIHQPSMAKTFAKEDAFVISFFYDRTKPLGMPDSFTLREMHDLADTVCHGQESWGIFESIPGAMEELEDRPEYCLDLNFMMALLHTGYEMPIDREVKTAKKINDNELGWCLGASLPLLAPGSGWQCKVQKVA